MVLEGEPTRPIVWDQMGFLGGVWLGFDTGDTAGDQ